MSATTTVVSGEFGDRLTEHHHRFSPLYAGFLSDHGPMTALALAGLGARSETASSYLAHYQTRLTPATTSPEGYAELLADTLAQVRTAGPVKVLERELPDLISGWARDAYHPLIRTAYGFEFGIDEEVAAGVAYMKWCGADETISRQAENARQAGNATQIADPAVPFSLMKRCASSVTAGRNFTQALSEVIADPEFSHAAVVHSDHLAVFSRRALDVFAATHNFFALHLVTGSHAYRILYPFAGALRDPIFSLGLLGGYAAIGAPAFEPFPSAAESPAAQPAWAAALLGGESWPDEHDVKLAYSAASQADYFSDPAYIEVAANYLDRRSH